MSNRINGLGIISLIIYLIETPPREKGAEDFTALHGPVSDIFQVLFSVPGVLLNIIDLLTVRQGKTNLDLSHPPT